MEAGEICFILVKINRSAHTETEKSGYAGLCNLKSIRQFIKHFTLKIIGFVLPSCLTDNVL